MILLLLGLLLQDAPGRTYHRVRLEAVRNTTWTHVLTCGHVSYVRRMADADWHVTLSRGDDFVVLEIIPRMPMDPPRKGQTIEAWGITRTDKGHRTKRYPEGWPELHPLEGFRVVKECK